MTESTLIEERPAAPQPGVESIFAQLLAEVLSVDRVSVDSHFFDELGADSLVMAHFCARIRKRGGLPPVSMREIYRHPTIRSPAALTDTAPAAARPTVPAPIELPTPTSTREYVVCGALQLLFFLGYSYVAALAASGGYEWISDASNGVEIYVRSVLFGGAAFLSVCLLPILAKWVLIGRWKTGQIRIWSLAYSASGSSRR